MPPTASAPTTVLVVDDEAAIRRFLRATLTAQGYDTVEAPTAGEGLRAVRHHHPDLVLLDLGLPDRDGIELILEIRKLTDAPVLVLTARDAEASKVQALDQGADDYVTKPFSVPELLARMRTALRHRVQAQGGRATVEAGPVLIDLVYRRVTRDGQEVRLSAKEWAILERLAVHAGRVVTHGQVLREVWGRDGATEQQYLRVYMRQLRQKLEPDPNRPQLLLTEPGVGYRLLPNEPEMQHALRHESGGP
jgi:two-component system, OmpR family, KDP operon response regulator KdpE